MLSRRAILALVIAGMTVVAVPGAGGEAIQEGGEDPTVIHIYASDFAFVLDRTIIPAGPVQFVLINRSEEYRHEAWIYPIDERDGPHFHEMLHLKRTGQRANEPDYIEGIVARSGELVAADATTFLADLPIGVYEVACFIREGSGDVRMVHYDGGMYAVLAVRARGL